MISPAQHDILESFFGVNGDLFKVIQDDDSFDLGTKILYLERAISEDCTIFLNSLDKLYNPHLSGQAETANLDFIRTLKAINDLCFNNTVNRGIYGSEEALYFLRKLNMDVDFNPLDYQTRIQEMVNQRISELNTTEADAQKAQRITHENHILRQTQWRDELNLPPAQRAMVVSNGALTVMQYQLLDDTIKQIIDSEPDFTLRLIQEYHLTLNDIVTLSIQKLNQLFNEASSSIALMDAGHISLALFLTLEPLIRIAVLSDPGNVFELMENGVLFSDLIILEHDILSGILSEPFEMISLIKNCNIPFTDLASLNPKILSEVLRNHVEIEYLVNANIPFTDLASLSPEILSEVLRNHVEIKCLINANISFTDLASLSPEILSEILRNHVKIECLINANIPFTDLGSLSIEILNEMLRNQFEILCLVISCNIPFAHLMSLSPKVLNETLKYDCAMIELINERQIPFEQLTNLTLEDLQQVLANPDSKAAQDILNPPTLGYRV